MKCKPPEFSCGKDGAAEFGIGPKGGKAFVTAPLCNRHKFWYQLRGYSVVKSPKKDSDVE